MPAKQEVENPGAFKLWINKDVLTRMAKEIANVHADFDQKTFIRIAPELDPLELKPRVRLIRDQLKKQLPQEYPKALAILLASLKRGKLSGFALWPYTEFIQAHGLEHRTESLKALAEITELFTGEFAVRPFLNKDTDETLAFLKKCARDKNEHLRRWASEGSRPRLPWGERLDVFIKHPEKTLEILEMLKHDESLYVRKSVANHLNDISKDNPALVVKTLKRWNKEAEDFTAKGTADKKSGAKVRGENAQRVRWITHRALRTLIKKGDAGALSAIGVSSKPMVKVSGLTLNKDKFKIGDRLELSFEIKSLSKTKQRLVVDYLIHFMKSNKATAPKVFKLKALDLAEGRAVKIAKQHHLKLITTRRFYPGAHKIEIQVNGLVMASAEWHLRL